MVLVQENTFKPMPLFNKVSQNHIFTDHAWLEDDKIVGCTAEGELYFFENNELKQYVDNAFNSEENLMYVSCLRTFNKGFFISSDNGYMALWVRSEENNSTTGK